MRGKPLATIINNPGIWHHEQNDFKKELWTSRTSEMSDMAQYLKIGYSKRVWREDVTPSGVQVRWQETEVDWVTLAQSLLEREKNMSDRVREAASNLLIKLDQIEKDTKGIFAIAHIHGVNYEGANWAKEYRELRAALEGKS